MQDAMRAQFVPLNQKKGQNKKMETEQDQDMYDKTIEELTDLETPMKQERQMTNLQRVRQAKAQDNERRTNLYADATALDAQREEISRPVPALQQRLGQLQSQVARLSGEAAELRQGLDTAAVLAEAGVETDTGAERARLEVVLDSLKPVTADLAKVQTRIVEVGAHLDELARRAADIRKAADTLSPDLYREERQALLEQLNLKRLAYIKILSEAAVFNGQWPQAFYNGQVDGMRYNGKLDEIVAMTPPHLRNLQPLPAPDATFFSNVAGSKLTNSHGTYDYEAECRALGIRLEDLE